MAEEAAEEGAAKEAAEDGPAKEAAEASRERKGARRRGREASREWRRVGMETISSF